jgi:hypothetical protein
MQGSPLLTTYLLCASLTLDGVALGLYLYTRPRSQMRFVAAGLFVLGTLFLAMALQWRWEDRRRRRRAKSRYGRRLRDRQ